MTNSEHATTTSTPDETVHQLASRARQRADQAMRLVCANLPWLSGLAWAVRIQSDERVGVAAISASGRLLINPDVFAAINIREATYILAHELLHLALDTFSRESQSDDHETVNRAHDYIINDILRSELQMSPPLHGLDLLGASEQSLEKIVRWMNDNKDQVPTACWRWEPQAGHVVGPSGNASSASGLSQALVDAGLIEASDGRPSSPERARSWDLENLDVIPRELERELFPESETTLTRQIEPVRREAARALSLREVSRAVNQQTARGNAPGSSENFVGALRGTYVTPWEVALQRWMEAVAPGQRTYARPSRRGADRTDCVLPGRSREGWTLHLVLDTSGSMSDELARMLGAIAMFCESSGVADVHIMQCDTEVTVDEWVPIEDLENYRIAGYGGSDMSPAMLQLADDPEVTAMIVLTDGWIDYPELEPPCRVLWVLTSEHRDFEPPYGELLNLSEV